MARCAHGRLFACPFPGCPCGVAGDQLVLCGPEGAVYFERGLIVEDGQVVAGWVRKAATSSARMRRRVAAGG